MELYDKPPADAASDAVTSTDITAPTPAIACGPAEELVGSEECILGSLLVKVNDAESPLMISFVRSVTRGRLSADNL